MAKQKRDSTLTKNKILLEARTLFSKQGFDATTIDDIAKSSYVNKALIYYYFKNKAGLYSEVMSGLFDTIYDEIISTQKECSLVIEELEVFIETYATYANTHPYFPALLLRELSDSGAHLPEVMFTSMRRLFLLLSNILQRGTQEKVFNPSLPMVVHFMIIGTINLMVTTKPLRNKALLFDKSIDTCSTCSADDVSSYVFESIKKSLEVKK